MDNKSKELLNTILAKHISAITVSDMVFLKARSSYLTSQQKEKYFGTVKEETSISYAELLDKAKSFGYKGPRIGKEKLIEYINSK